MVTMLNDIIYESDGGYKTIGYKLCRENIYAGIVVQETLPEGIILNNEKYSIDKAYELGLAIPTFNTHHRKILFTKNEDNSANDLLYHSPNYSIENSCNDEIRIMYPVFLGDLLTKNKFNKFLTDSDIKVIYKLFLEKNNEFVNSNHLYLPMSSDDFKKLKLISEITRKPSDSELNMYSSDYSFKSKVKMFTKK